MCDGDHHDRGTRLLRRKRRAAGDPEVDRHKSVVGSSGQEFADKTGDLATAFDWESDPAMRNCLLLRIQPQLERRDHAEVGAGAAHAPEQIGVLILARMQPAAVGGDQVDGPQVVDREAELALEAAHAAPEREPGDSGVSDHAHRARKTL